MVSAANGVAARFGSSVRAAALAGGGPPCGSAHSFQNPPFRRACPAGCIRNYSQHFFALNVRPGRQRGALWWTGCKRKAVACMAQRAERRRRRNHPPEPAAIVPPRQPYFVILNGANRRTQRVQRPLADSSEQGGERQTKCSQESVYVYFYTESSSIFRSPQNDKLLNCSQTPRQTGICNWRQRGEVKGKDRCSGRSRLAEININFSRASRSPALRRLAKLAPRTSARKQHSADRSRARELKPACALSE